MKSIRTEGINLVNTTEEFSEDFVGNLGLRAFDPEEVERNVETQIEKQMGLLPEDIFEAMKLDGKRLKKDEESGDVIDRALRIAKGEILRLRTDEYKRRDELMIKIKLLQDMLPTPTTIIIENSKAVVPNFVNSSSSSYSTSNNNIESKPRPKKREEPVKQPQQQETEVSCPNCNDFVTKSIRQLNLHLNQCLKVKKKETEEENVLSSSSEDDIEEELKKQNKKTKTIKVNTTPQIGEDDGKLIERNTEDDLNPKYCKQRLGIFRNANNIWISTWNSCLQQQGLSESEAHLKAEQEFEKEFTKQQEKILNNRDEDEDEEDEDEEVEDDILIIDDSEHDSPINGADEPKHCILEDLLYCPQRLYNRLLPHQKETLSWLFTHHRNSTGAILGDEMGLGKTAQIISFLACLKISNELNLPSLVIAPATTLSQWVQEFNEWYTPFRIIVLHDSFKTRKQKKRIDPPRTGPEVVSKAFDENECDIIITTFKGLQIHGESLLSKHWGYVILDEAHSIRNPDINITLACKKVKTCHRIALTGAPIQNRLRELWSLFDFVCPRRLGTLPTFESLFAEPIRIGGMMGATPNQVYQAFEAAKSLRDSVTPFMLRRMKKDVATSLPEKTERVLFCNLTEYQRLEYLQYLKSDQINDLLVSSRRFEKAKSDQAGKAWRAISTLRKICNHPDLIDDGRELKSKTIEGIDDLLNGSGDEDVEDNNNNSKSSSLHLDKNKSAKMMVLDKVLTEWRKQGHKVLVFCQGTKMLSVLENYAKQIGWPTMRMDGSTVVKKRQLLISKFNHGDISNTFLFLLTTRVGGVGVNLTGATRVVIFDPDWNPSTDAQARERAWRLGQTKPVTVYRLIISGTIEEKIYHRQIFKQFLTNKVLHDPSQRRFFKESDLRDLFTLNEPKSNDEDDTGFNNANKSRLGGVTDTSQMFSEEVIDLNNDESSKGKKKNDNNDDDETDNKLLKSLFQSDDVFREAFDHDRVEIASRSQREKLIAEKRAKALAKKAKNELLQEQQSMNHIPLDVPTYTGGNGPPPSALSIITALRGGFLDSASTSSSNMATVSPYTRALKDIREYLLKAGSHGATSAEIWNLAKYLQKEIDGADVLRALLRDVARFDEIKKKWILKKNKT